MHFLFPYSLQSCPNKTHHNSFHLLGCFIIFTFHLSIVGGLPSHRPLRFALGKLRSGRAGFPTVHLRGPICSSTTRHFLPCRRRPNLNFSKELLMRPVFLPTAGWGWLKENVNLHLYMPTQISGHEILPRLSQLEPFQKPH